MDYIGHKCPVCSQYFHIGDDVVVCPECGTPYHRECYNINGKCINADKHAQGYDYSKDSCVNNETEDGFVICKKCGTQNEDDAFFCKKCSAPLHETNASTYDPYSQNQRDSQPFGTTPNVMFFDPLGGVNAETDFGDGVTAGECAKFTKQNTHYFSIVFNNIVRFNKSRFNFCALLFGGGYLLYRKMYKLGSVITSIQAIMMLVRMYISTYTATSPSFTKLFDAYYSGDTNAVVHHFTNLSTYDMTLITLYSVLTILSIGLSIAIGVFANRMYFKHCKKQIVKIKNCSKNTEDIEKEYVKKGGVNVALAMSLLISEVIISYLPYMFV